MSLTTVKSEYFRILRPPAVRWIPVAESRPPLGFPCLVYAPPRDRDPAIMMQATLTQYGWWPVGEYRADDITHWTPRPELPLAQSKAVDAGETTR